MHQIFRRSGTTAWRRVGKTENVPRLHDRSFVDAVAVVTGAGTEVGSAAALALSERGAEVVLVDLDGAGAQLVAQEIAATGGRVSVFEADLVNLHSLDTLADEIVTSVGPIDIVVNIPLDPRSGGGWPKREDVTANDWEWVRSTSLDSVMLACRAFGPRLLANGSGHIVNVSPPAQGGTYQFATRAAVLAFSRRLRSDWSAHGVGVSAVAGAVARPSRMATAICRAIEKDRGVISMRLSSAPRRVLNRLALARAL